MDPTEKLRDLLAEHAGDVLAHAAEEAEVRRAINAGPIGRALAHVAGKPEINRLVNAGLISHAVEAMPSRPLPYSLWTHRPIGAPYHGVGPEPPSDYMEQQACQQTLPA